LSPFETKYKHVVSDYINPHPLCNRSDSAPYPTSEKIRIYNRIRIISAPLHIRQKNMDADVVKVLSDPIRSDPLSSLSAADLLCKRHSSLLPNVGGRASLLVSIVTHLQISRPDYGATARTGSEAVVTPSSHRWSAAAVVGRRELGRRSRCSPNGRC
jgi:hypothetical protein